MGGHGYNHRQDAQEYDTEVEVIYLRKTNLAIKVIDAGTEDFDEPIWLPKSQIYYDEDDCEEMETITVTMPEWLAIEKDLV